jgi:hypothetical protein
MACVGDARYISDICDTCYIGDIQIAGFLRSCVIVLRDRRIASRVTESARNYCMRADIYQKLHEFNLHIEQGVAALLGLSQVKKVKSYLLRRYAENFEEIKTAASGYLTSLISDQEEDEAGRLFAKRRHEEMAEDPMHGGWLEEERDKKRLERLRKAGSAGKASKPK